MSSTQGQKKDMHESIMWYSEDDTATASRFVETVHETISALAENQLKLLESIGEIRANRLKKFPYLIVFR